MSDKSVKDVLFEVLQAEPAARPARIRELCDGDASLIARVEALVASHEEASAFLSTPTEGGAAGAVFDEVARAVPRTGEHGRAGSGDESGDGDVGFGDVGEDGEDGAGDVGDDGRGDGVDDDRDDRADRDDRDDVGADARPHPADPAELRPGETLGPYTIVRRAGAGGFGVVYVADQTQPVARRVALKVLHQGLDSATALARFEAERQALARMDHPAIARVFDAGTNERGRPFIAIEYVPGERVTDYCRGHAMPLRERLALFRLVCQAIQHAHEKGVIHRDLKPSNILVADVDGTPMPKVIDFGIAKATDRPLVDLTVSREGQLLGTPSYMSPEQAAGDADVDTRSDIYSLGVLLYELLSGRVPFDVEALGLTALLRAIVEEDPPLPSRALDPTGEELREVPADLDWIVMRCLEKDRGRRYPSAAALAADVGRFLRDEPVDAAPPSTWYRARKLVRRHRGAAAAAVAVLLTLVAGVIGTWSGLLEARRANDALRGANENLAKANEQLVDTNVRLETAIARARDEAERARRAEELAAEQAARALEEEATARAINEFLTEDLLSAAVPSTERGRGRDVSLREVLDVAAEGIEAAGARGGRFDGRPRVEAEIRRTLGSVYAALGEFDASVHHLRRAIERSAEVPDGRIEELWSRSLLGQQLLRLGSLQEAEALIFEALAGLRDELGPLHGLTISTVQHLAELRYEQDRLEEAYALLDAAWSDLSATRPAIDRASLGVLGLLAVVAQETRREAVAERLFRQNLELRRAVYGPHHPDTHASVVNLTAFLTLRRRWDEAETLLSESYDAYLEVFGPDHPRIAATLYTLATIALERGRAAEAETALRRTLGIYEHSYGPGHPLSLQALAMLARALEEQGEREEAEAFYRRAYEGTLEALGPRHHTTDARRRELSAFLFPDRSRRPEVLSLLEESLRNQRESFGGDHPNTLAAVVNLAILAKDEGQLDDAERLLVEALIGLRGHLGPEHPEVLDTESTLAGTYIDQERFDEALELARHSVEAGERAMPADAYDLARFRLRLGLALEGVGDRQGARDAFEEAHAVLASTRGGADPMTVFAADWLAADTEREPAEVTGTEPLDTERAGTEQPGTEQPETEQPGTEQPETEQPETEQPETEQPDR